MPLSLGIFCSYFINCRISINWANSRLLVQWNGTVYYCEYYFMYLYSTFIPFLIPPPLPHTVLFSRSCVSILYCNHSASAPFTNLHGELLFHQLLLSSLCHDRRMQTLITTSYAFVYLSLFLHPSGNPGKWRRSYSDLVFIFLFCRCPHSFPHYHIIAHPLSCTTS